LGPGRANRGNKKGILAKDISLIKEAGSKGKALCDIIEIASLGLPRLLLLIDLDWDLGSRGVLDALVFRLHVSFVVSGRASAFWGAGHCVSGIASGEESVGLLVGSRKWDWNPAQNGVGHDSEERRWGVLVQNHRPGVAHAQEL
jgi:hypothetical protein